MSKLKEGQTISAQGANLSKISIPDGIEKNNENEQKTCVNSDNFTYGNSQDSQWFDGLKVGYYEHCKANEGRIATFSEFVESVKTAPSKEQAAVRLAGLDFARCEDDSQKKTLEGKYKGLKAKNLGLWTPCHASATRATGAPSVPNGLITLDIDNIKPEDVEPIKAALSKIPYICFAAVSCGGAGIVAYIRSSPELATSSEAIEYCWKLIIETIRSLTEIDCEADENCKDIKRGRFETFDRAPYVNKNAAIYRDLRDIKKLSNELFQKSEFVRLARLVGGFAANRDELPPWSSNCGVVHKLLALATYGLVKFSVKPNSEFPLRSQSVTLGELGAGKTVENSIYSKVLPQLGGTVVAPTSAASMLEAVKQATYDIETYEEGRKTKKKYRPKSVPVPIILDTEEFGLQTDAERNQEWAKKKKPFENIFFDSEFLPEVTKEDVDVNLPMANTCVAINGRSTPKAYAQGMAGFDLSSGALRRKWVYWMDSPINTLTDDMSDEERARRLADFQDIEDTAPRPQVEELTTEICKRKHSTFAPLIKRWRVNHVLRRAVNYALLDAWPREYRNSSTALQTIHPQAVFAVAYARNWTDELITDDDYLAGCALVFGLIESMQRVAGIVPDSKLTREESIRDVIREYISARGARVLYSQVKRYFLKRGGAYMAELDAMFCCELIREKDNSQKAYVVRFATDEEAEALAMLADKDLTDSGMAAGLAGLGGERMRTVRDTWQSWSAENRTPWEQCSQEVREKRYKALIDAAFKDCVHDSGTNGRYAITRGVMWWFKCEGVWSDKACQDLLKSRAVDTEGLKPRNWDSLVRSTK